MSINTSPASFQYLPNRDHSDAKPEERVHLNPAYSIKCFSVAL